ncbi:curli production assembly protein CsgG [bacterium]|nr:MAG: curli production assembly protein CsgG [bacterium]
MRKTLVLAVVLVFLCGAAAFGQTNKKKVAVLDFEFGSVQKWWGEGTWDIGKGISDLVLNELLKDGTYRLIERKKIDVLLGEQQAFGDPAKSNGDKAGKIGKLLGVNAMITGSVTQFGTEEKKTGFGGGLFPTRVPFIGGVGKAKGKAKVSLAARLINAQTGEIIASATGSGESSRSGLILGVLSSKGGGGISMTSSDFKQTILGEATYAAVGDLVKALLELNAKIPATILNVRGQIASVDGAKVVLNVGSEAGIEPGAVLQVFEVLQSIKDPATGLVLTETVKEIGQIKVDQVEAKWSAGTIVAGQGIAIGSLIRNLPSVPAPQTM